MTSAASSVKPLTFQATNPLATLLLGHEPPLLLPPLITIVLEYLGGIVSQLRDGTYHTTQLQLREGRLRPLRQIGGAFYFVSTDKANETGIAILDLVTCEMQYLAMRARDQSEVEFPIGYQGSNLIARNGNTFYSSYSPQTRLGIWTLDSAKGELYYEGHRELQMIPSFLHFDAANRTILIASGGTSFSRSSLIVLESDYREKHNFRLGQRAGTCFFAAHTSSPTRYVLAGVKALGFARESNGAVFDEIDYPVSGRDAGNDYAYTQVGKRWIVRIPESMASTRENRFVVVSEEDEFKSTDRGFTVSPWSRPECAIDTNYVVGTSDCLLAYRHVRHKTTHEERCSITVCDSDLCARATLTPSEPLYVHDNPSLHGEIGFAAFNNTIVAFTQGEKGVGGIFVLKLSNISVDKITH